MSQRFLRAVVPALFCALASVAYANLQDANENDDAKARGPAQAQAADDDSSLEALEAQANPMTLKAIDLYIEGNVDGAYALFKQVYEENPDSDPPGILIATLHSHAGRFLDMRRA